MALLPLKKSLFEQLHGLGWEIIDLTNENQRPFGSTLTGDRRRRWAMTVNRRWRVTFRFEDGNAHEVTIEDYHKG